MSNVVSLLDYKFKKGLASSCRGLEVNKNLAKEMRHSKKVATIDIEGAINVMSHNEDMVRRLLHCTKDVVPPIAEKRLTPMLWTGENWRWFLKTHLSNN